METLFITLAVLLTVVPYTALCFSKYEKLRRMSSSKASKRIVLELGHLPAGRAASHALHSAWK